jgi:hypothetical protein
MKSPPIAIATNSNKATLTEADQKCECGSPINPYQTTCDSCERPTGYPNVRWASSRAEIDALVKRVEAAFVSAKAGGYEKKLLEFQGAVKKSKAVMCCPLAILTSLVEPNKLIATYYNQISAQQRVPKNDVWENMRPQVDETLFPHNKGNIQYAALSLNNKGVIGFGECHLVFKEGSIKDRTSAFEENSCIFFKKHAVAVGRPIPPGYKTTWAERDKLAVAKLYSLITTTIDSSQFPEILIKNAKNAEEADFIELHIYGKINQGTIESVTLPKTAKDKAVFATLKSIKEKLAKNGIRIEESVS